MRPAHPWSETAYVIGLAHGVVLALLGVVGVVAVGAAGWAALGYYLGAGS